MTHEELLRTAYVQLRQLRAELERVNELRNEPIAIVGVACRFPGHINHLDDFWEFLVQKKDAVREVPKERWDVDAYFDPSPEAPGKMYTRWGSFLEEIDLFDPQFFDIAPREAIEMDPQHRLLLETAWEALEHAGEPPERWFKGPVGVFMGHGPSEYKQYSLFTGDPEHINSYNLLNNSSCFSAGRISHAFGFQGPAMQLDTACSTSLLAVHLAADSLRNRSCDLAIAGGVNLTLTPEITIGLSKIRALSPDGRCKTYSAGANGYVRGEGCGVMVLKRLKDAVEARDHILAVVRSSAVNHDGRSNGITAPNGEAQEKLYREVLAKAGLTGLDVDYIEAHGTGTLLGDSIEAQSLGTVYGEGRTAANPILAGSVKTNLGHLEWAAGVAGMFKAILALKTGQIPANLHFDRPNPHIRWDALPLRVPVELTPWPVEREVRRAAVSSFGISGTNVHLLLESPPALPERETAKRASHLFCISARDGKALEELGRRYITFLRKLPAEQLEDACFSANAGRSSFAERIAVQGASAEELAKGIDAAIEGKTLPYLKRGKVTAFRPPKIAFLFSGQGAQYSTMGRELYASEPVFRDSLNRCAEVLKLHLDVPLTELLWHEPYAALLRLTRYTQPALFALEVGLATLWESWGVRPDMVAGHSLGEYAAACIAGVFSLEDGLKLIAARGALMQSLPEGGGMLSIAVDESTARDWAAAYKLDIAASNGPRSMVLSGGLEDLERLSEELSSRGIKAKRLDVSHAFHSARMEPILDEFTRIAQGVRYFAPRIPIFCNLTGESADSSIASAAYWVRQLREPVRFGDMATNLRKAGCQVFIETGPDAVLLPMASAMPGGEECAWLPSLRRGKGDLETLHRTVAALYVRGCRIDWQGFYAPHSPAKIPLPLYPFQKQRYWFPSERLEGRTRALEPGRLKENGRLHPLLGAEVRLARQSARVFQNTITTRQAAFLADHRLRSRTIFPAAGYLEMAYAAGARAYETESVQISAATVHKPLALKEDSSVTVQVMLEPEPTGRASKFEIYALRTQDEDAHSWELLVDGRLEPATQTSDRQAEQRLDRLWDNADKPLKPESLYERFERAGLEYGPAFRSIERVSVNSHYAMSKLKLPETRHADAMFIHPILLDGAFQTLAAISQEDSLRLPLGLDRLTFWKKPERELICQAIPVTDEQQDSDLHRADFLFFNEQGEPIGEAAGLLLKETSMDAIERALDGAPARVLYETVWQPLETQPIVKTTTPSVVVFVRDAALEQALRSELPSATFVRPGTQYAEVEPGVYTIRPENPEDFKCVIPADAAVLYGWPLSTSTFRPEDPSTYLDEQRFGFDGALRAAQANPAAIVFATRGTQSVTGEELELNPVHGALWGLGRVINLEMTSTPCRRIDLDPSVSPVAQANWLASEIRTQDTEDDVAIRGDRRWAARLRPVTAKPLPDSFRLVTPEYGRLDKLHYAPFDRPAPGPDEVEISVAASSLNFRDVLHALGMLPETAERMPFGFEAAGYVTAVGSQVTRFAPGDEVLTGCTFGAFGSHVIGRQNFTWRKPSSLTFAEAAALPIAYLTAYYGLRELAKIRPGDRVLIHAAAGGVGIAAVRIALHAGATVFATASAGKQEYLRSIGVQHVMNSRDLKFREEVEVLLGPQGVDVVLNSLNGEYIPESLSLLRPGGRFVEIGKIGIWSAEQVAQKFPDITYFVFDLDQIAREQPALVRRLFEDVMTAIEDESLAPIPVTEFDSGQTPEAFRFMSQAKHVGKVVVTFSQRQNLRRDSCYLITGGLGGLGIEIAECLAKQGAGEVVLTSRRPPSESAQRRIQEIEALGTAVQVRCADLSDEAQVRDLVTGLGHRLRGIVHAAGVLDDGIIAEQTPERYRAALAPKGIAAIHLHNAIGDAPLDFFISFSSLASQLGLAGQANYAGANAFLDSFTHWRNRRGHRSQTINWGPWGESGMATTMDARNVARMESRGIRPFSTSRGVELFLELLELGPVQATAVDVAWPRYLRQFSVDRIPGLLESFHQSGEKTSDKRPALQERQRLAGLSPGDRKRELVALVQAELAEILGMENSTSLDCDTEFSRLGIDSLMGVQFKARMEPLAGRVLGAAFAFDYPTVTAVAEFLDGTFGEQPTENVSPIPRQSRVSKEFPLSAAQERMWFADRWTPDVPVYTEYVSLRLKGELRVDVLHQSLQLLVDDEEVLRTSFHERDGRLVQVIHDSVPVPFHFVEGQPIEEAARNAARRVFSLENAPLFEATLICESERSHVLVLTSHHIVIDGWSFQMVWLRLLHYYDKLSKGEAVERSTRQLDYADYAVWDRERAHEGLDYWSAKLAGVTSGTELHGDFTRPAVRTGEGAIVRFDLDPELTSDLKKLAQQENVTLFMLMLAAFQCLIARYAGDNDCTTGLAVTNRSIPGLENVLGMFVNALVLRTQFSASDSFREALRKVKGGAVEGYHHAELPFQKVVESLQLPRQSGRNPLFQTVFDLQVASKDFYSVPGLDLEIYYIDNKTAKFDLACALLDADAMLRGELEYSTDLFTEQTVRRLIDSYEALLRGVVKDPAALVWELPLMSSDEHRRILAMSRGLAAPSDCASVQEMFERVVRTQPDARALVDDRGSLTYRQLDEHSDALAALLQEKEISKGEYVAIFLDRSILQCIVALAVAKAGAAYVPLDPVNPEARLREILKNSGAKLVITASHAPWLREAGVEVLRIDQTRPPHRRPEKVTSGEDPLYVMYTSGSTGKPKGVVVPHRGIVNLVSWQRRALHLTQNDRCTMMGQVGFDASAWEFWSAIANGTTLYLVPNEVRVDPERLVAWYATNRITVSWAPTPLAELLLVQKWPANTTLRILNTGGDKLRRAPSQPLPFQLINNYGPTEYSVVAMSGVIEPNAEEAPPIGRPIDNTEVYVLDQSGQLTPDGVTGEIYIGGPGLALRYQGDPALTQERFVPHSLSQGMLYRTGDLARRRSDGSLIFVGRSDEQVKVRGVRIEIGEIESILASHPKVNEAVVCMRETRSGDRSLAAFAAAPGATVAELHDFLAERLPGTMMPASITLVEALPLTANGKIDRRKLLADWAPLASQESHKLTPEEQAIADIFATVLELETVSPQESFFDLGGHSLLAARVAQRIQAATGIAVTVQDIFAAPTVAGLALKLKQPHQAPGSGQGNLVPLQHEGSKPPLYLVCPASGSALCYLDLARDLGTERPVYGLEAPALSGRCEPFETVEELAAYFEKILLEQHAGGRYLIGGWSYGGLVAYELARLLRKRGKEVSVFLLDIELLNQGNRPSSTTGLSVLAAGIREGSQNMLQVGVPSSYAQVRRLASWVGISLPHTLGGLLGRNPRAQWRFLLEVLGMAHRSLKMFYTHFRAGRVYLFCPLDADVFLFKTSTVASPVTQRLKELVTGRLETIPIPGSHMTLFEGTNRSALVAVLRERLDVRPETKKSSAEKSPNNRAMSAAV